MSKFKDFKRLMNSRIKKYDDDVLLLMWNDWHCEHDIFKVPYRELGIGRNDRNNLVKVMAILGIEEVIALTGINHRVYPAYFNEENKAMFATMQNQIATKREYRIYDSNTPNR